jgi:hypothetical protein
MNFKAIKTALEELKMVLAQLSNNDYSLPILFLGNASIGEHTRHIIEMFQCLLSSYETGLLNYDNRLRNNLIETNAKFAIQNIDEIIFSIDKNNKKININQLLFDQNITLESNYFRELLYNLEHCIHHQALIKVALFQFENIQIVENFGIAPSTIKHRKQCVQ